MTGKEQPQRISRQRNEALDAILGEAFPVLNGQGFIRVVDYMGSDASIVRAARVSYGAGTKTVSEDAALIDYLLRHYHTTPFEMCEITLHVRVPMDLWRQQIRQRTASVNEYSTRYSIAIDECATTPPGKWRTQSQNNKQGSMGTLDVIQGAHFSERELQLHALVREVYNERIEAGIAREQARKDLLLSNFTEAYWKIDLHNLMNFLGQRMDSHAQQEIRECANVMAGFVEKWVPATWAAFKDHRLNAMRLSGNDIALLCLINTDPAAALALAVERGFANADGTARKSTGRVEFEAKLDKLGMGRFAPWKREVIVIVKEEPVAKEEPFTEPAANPATNEVDKKQVTALDFASGYNYAEWLASRPLIQRWTDPAIIKGYVRALYEAMCGKSLGVEMAPLYFEQNKHVNMLNKWAVQKWQKSFGIEGDGNIGSNVYAIFKDIHKKSYPDIEADFNTLRATVTRLRTAGYSGDCWGISDAYIDAELQELAVFVRKAAPDHPHLPENRSKGRHRNGFFAKRARVVSFLTTLPFIKAQIDEGLGDWQLIEDYIRDIDSYDYREGTVADLAHTLTDTSIASAAITEKSYDSALYHLLYSIPDPDMSAVGILTEYMSFATECVRTTDGNLDVMKDLPALKTFLQEIGILSH